MHKGMLICFFLILSVTISLNSLLAQDTAASFPTVVDTTTLDTAFSSTDAYIRSVEDEQFAIFLLLLGTAGVCFMVGFFLVGVLVFLILLGIVVLCIAAGVISTSVFIGWYKRSLTSGFKSFIIIVASLIGIVSGILGLGLISYLFKLEFDRSTISIAGSICGLITGALLGLVVFKVLRISFRYLKNRLQLAIK